MLVSKIARYTLYCCLSHGQVGSHNTGCLLYVGLGEKHFEQHDHIQDHGGHSNDKN